MKLRCNFFLIEIKNKFDKVLIDKYVIDAQSVNHWSRAIQK